MGLSIFFASLSIYGSFVSHKVVKYLFTIGSMSAGSLYGFFGKMDRITCFSALFETEVCQRLISSRAATGVCLGAYL